MLTHLKKGVIVIARIIWKENTLVNIQLKDDLFTIGQLLFSPFMRLYKIKNTDGHWQNIDLNNVESLFCVTIGKVVLKNLVKEKIVDKTVIPSNASFEKYWIDVHLNFEGGFPFKGGRLIEMGQGVESTTAPAVIENLDITRDREIIEKYELLNMWGDTDLAERLIHYFETGIDIDPIKGKVFPGLNK